MQFLLLEIPATDVVKYIPLMQYNVDQTKVFSVLGLDFDEFKSYTNILESVPGTIVKPIGKLDNLPASVASSLYEVLSNDEWDFIAFPNPEVVLITKLPSYDSREFKASKKDS